MAQHILEVPSAGGQPSFATLVGSVLPFLQAAGANYPSEVLLPFHWGPVIFKYSLQSLLAKPKVGPHA